MGAGTFDLDSHFSDDRSHDGERSVGYGWIPSSYLPVFDTEASDTLHPFLRLLAWYSYTYHEGKVLHLNGAQTDGRPFNPSVVPKDHVLKTLHFPPEELRQAFLESVKHYSVEIPFDRTEEVLNYAVESWIPRNFIDLNTLVWFLRDKGFHPAADNPHATFYDALCRLWGSFPFCDYRIEIAYYAATRLKDDPGMLFHDASFFSWALDRKTSENIALRHLWEQRSKIKQETPKKSSKRIKDLFTSRGKKPPKGVTFYTQPTEEDLVSVIAAHKELLIQGPYPPAMTRQLPAFYSEQAYSPKRVENAAAQEVYDTHTDLASDYLFRKFYLDLYREERAKKLTAHGVSLEHPLYEFQRFIEMEPINSFRKKSLDHHYTEDALFFSLAQDVYFMRDFDHWHVENADGLIDYCLTPEQSALFDRIEQQKKHHVFGRNERRIGYNFIESLIRSTRNAQSEKLLKYTDDLLLDPRACALYRIAILPPEASFEEKMDAIGLPYGTGSMEVMSEMANLMNWLHSSTSREEDKTIFPNCWTVSTLYLAAKIKEYFENFDADECKKIAKTVSKLTKLEQPVAQGCPELILIATFSEGYTNHKLDTIPYNLFEVELRNYRYGEKRIARREQFIADFSSILEIYNLIKSDQWFYSLNKEMNAYIASKVDPNLKPSAQPLPAPRP